MEWIMTKTTMMRMKMKNSSLHTYEPSGGD